MPASERTLRLMALRDDVDEKFVHYVEVGLSGNFRGLAHLAIIGGRLDRIIARNLAAERKHRQ